MYLALGLGLGMLAWAVALGVHLQVVGSSQAALELLVAGSTQVLQLGVGHLDTHVHHGEADVPQGSAVVDLLLLDTSLRPPAHIPVQ